MLIKLWDWEKKWTCSQVFEGHTHYVMQIVINPKDNNQFASASLDRTIKVLHVRARCLYTEVSERVCVCVCACLRKAMWLERLHQALGRSSVSICILWL